MENFNLNTENLRMGCSGDIFIIHTVPTHIYVQTPCKSEFCIIGAF